MTPPIMYYSVAWVWLEYLTKGLDAAEDAMSKCLEMIQPQRSTTTAGDGAGLPPDGSGSFGSGRTLPGERSYCKSSVCSLSAAQSSVSWKSILAPHRPLRHSMCEVGRMHWNSDVQPA